MSGRRALRLLPHGASRLSTILLFGIAAMVATSLPAASASERPIDDPSTLVDQHPESTAVTGHHDAADIVPAECPTTKAGWVLHSPPRTVPGPAGAYLLRDWSDQGTAVFVQTVGSAGDPDRGPPAVGDR